MFSLTKAGMPEQPNCCLTCGGTPSNDDGTQKPAIYADGVDVDWGNSVYICWDCGELIADLMGRATRGGFDDLTEKYEELKAQHEELLEEHEKQEALIEKIREGSAAQKTLKTKAAA